jgi:hypothetical protein
VPISEFKDDSGKVTVTIDPNVARIDVGATGRAGQVVVRNAVNGNQEVFLGGGDGVLIVGGNETNGRIQVQNSEAQTVIRIDAANKSIGVGTANPARRLHVEESEIHSGGANCGISFMNRETPGFASNPGERWVWYATGKTARLWSAGDRVAVTQAGSVGIGTTNPARRLHVEGEEVHSGGTFGGMSFGNRETAAFTSNPGERWVWYSSGKTARLWSAGDKVAVTAGGSMGIGTTNPARRLHVEADEIHSGGPNCGFSFMNRETPGFASNPGERWVWYATGKTARLWSGGDRFIFTAEGDIQLLGADCSEDFDVEQDGVEPGTVMVLTDAGTLRPSDTEYDTRVAGVVAGAGPYRPGITLDRRETTEPRCSVALVGKVFCKADATAAPIRTGDLLATAPTTGHAMRASDRERAFGAVLGKAMGALESGRGEIPVLVALQ